MCMIRRWKDTWPVWLCHLIVAITNFPLRQRCEIYHSMVGKLPAMSTGWLSLLFQWSNNASRHTWCHLFCLVCIRILPSEFYHASVFTLYILHKGHGETMFVPLFAPDIPLWNIYFLIRSRDTFCRLCNVSAPCVRVLQGLYLVSVHNGVYTVTQW